ncbi:hypothetical protein [Paenibacillus alkalitolerans]|uniref:hypothetical protein n=1 Tax=Paenibacillus alkalitolerans TaxID=2799335 RepID=UPI0018F69133|nr:hypothetical protein [Paenibacillus alkalitolerans]
MKVNDNRKLYRSVYDMKPGIIEEIEIPALQFIVQEGKGKLNSFGRPEEQYWAVWKTVNQLKRITKERNGYQFKLMPHEIVWYENIGGDAWSYSQMMQVPDLITFDMYEEARASVVKRYRDETVPSTKFVSVKQGFCIQKLHVGHYRESGKIVEDLKDYAASKGYKVLDGRREVYLNPPECYPSPDRWQTIVRLQVGTPNKEKSYAE